MPALTIILDDTINSKVIKESLTDFIKKREVLNFYKLFENINYFNDCHLNIIIFFN